MTPEQSDALAALEAASARYEQARIDREECLRAAKNAGASYAQMAQVMGLTRAGAQQAVKRLGMESSSKAPVCPSAASDSPTTNSPWSPGDAFTDQIALSEGRSDVSLQTRPQLEEFVLGPIGHTEQFVVPPAEPSLEPVLAFREGREDLGPEEHVALETGGHRGALDPGDLLEGHRVELVSQQRPGDRVVDRVGPEPAVVAPGDVEVVHDEILPSPQPDCPWCGPRHTCPECVVA